ncbi:MAG: hypothetical protein JW815_05995 [Candidatus Bathyarchaeota archaeon]|nr:hypothetical protein [Candidatus Bathyarchaeum sp.]
MKTHVTNTSLVAFLVLILTTTALVDASPTVVELTPDTAAKVALTGSTVNANVTVGVKAGDWMEYNVTYVGSGDPPEEYANWFKFQITDVQGTSITGKMIYEMLNGTTTTSNHTYDLKSGVLNLLVVPAGLKYADVFYHEDYGNITIAGTEESTYAGGTRTAFYATFTEKKVYWDKPTGIFLQSEQVLNGTEIAQKVMISATNRWIDPNASDNSEIDNIVFYAKIIAVVATVAIIAVLLIRMMKKREK